jgi:two-component system OmpR family sensor kinase
LHGPERKSLIRFVSLFVVLNTIFLLIISTMYYYYQKNIFLEARHNSMMYYSGNLLHHIYSSKNLTELKSHLSKDPRFDIGFLTKNHEILYTSAPNLVIPLGTDFFEYQNHFFYIDTVELEHLKEIHYIVIRARTIETELEQTRKSIYLFLLFSIVFLSIVIYALSKLFLHPLRDTIAKLDRFIRDTTHELNTPLSVITMSIEQLNKEHLDAKQLKQINRIHVASRTISNLYNDLTFLMMYEQNQNHNIAIDMPLLVEERLEYFRPLADAKRITVHAHLEPSTLIMDRDKMIRIIDNLLSNAIKYNKPSGAIDISLTAKFLRISDTGIGISGDKLDEIFNRYTRFDEANGGFGIGLNLIQMICQEYRFAIAVDSEIAKGTAFTITWESASR